MLHTVLGHCDLDIWSLKKSYRRNISPTLFEVTISNFVRRCILMLEIVAYYFWTTVT